MNMADDSSRTPSGAYVSFRLGGEHFAVQAACVREILEPSRITRVPFSSPHMLGVVNVRGQATAVMDLGHRFGLPPVQPGNDARIMILELSEQGERVVVGGIADAVVEVLELDETELAAAPTVAMRWRSECVLGVARKAGRYLIILDISRLLLTEQATLGPEGPEGETMKPS
jgi:purine-binding chemotaxis protein CheW